MLFKILHVRFFQYIVIFHRFLLFYVVYCWRQSNIMNLLTPWSSVLLENLTGPQVVKKFPTFYGTWRFITVFTSAHHLSLFWARTIQCMPPSHFLKMHFNIFLPSVPRSSKWSLILRFSHQNPVCTAPPYVLHAPPISFFLV